MCISAHTEGSLHCVEVSDVRYISTRFGSFERIEKRQIRSIIRMSGLVWLICGSAMSIIVLTLICLKCRRRRPVSHSKNKVILYQIRRGPYAPSISPFCLKLETFLRMAEIPYENDFSFIPSSKGKVPWIEYNGEVVEDSQFCMEFLTKKFGVDLNSHLSDKDRTLATAYRKLLEEDLYWYLVLDRWIFDKHQSVMRRIIPRVACWVIIYRVKQAAWYHGSGRHTEKEAAHIMKTDLQSLSDLLGNRLFMMGDSSSELDCAAFGILAQLKWHAPGSNGHRMITEHFPNLNVYCDRMKRTFWPDWNACIMKSEEVEQKKIH